MPAAEFAQLVLQVGMPIAMKIVEWIQAGKTVTPADWTLLDQLGSYTPAQALAAAGGAPTPKP
jgi:hypothetical protein